MAIEADCLTKYTRSQCRPTKEGRRAHRTNFFYSKGKKKISLAPHYSAIKRAKGTSCDKFDISEKMSDFFEAPERCSHHIERCWQSRRNFLPNKLGRASQYSIYLKFIIFHGTFFSLSLPTSDLSRSKDPHSIYVQWMMAYHNCFNSCIHIDIFFLPLSPSLLFALLVCATEIVWYFPSVLRCY